jgi:hypothetical protein
MDGHERHITAYILHEIKLKLQCKRINLSLPRKEIQLLSDVSGFAMKTNVILVLQSF